MKVPFVEMASFVHCTKLAPDYSTVYEEFHSSEDSMPGSKPGRPGQSTLTRELIVTTALDMADTSGIEQLSMRKLAAELGAGVMSLYYYVDDKDALIDALVDEVASEIEPAPEGASWATVARGLAVSAHHALLRHPWAIPWWSSARPGPHRIRVMENLLAALAAADLPPDIADLGFHALANHIQGFAQQRLAYRASTSDGDAAKDRLLPKVDLGSFPHVVNHIEYHRSGKHTHDEFEFVLDLILDGLERLRSA